MRGGAWLAAAALLYVLSAAAFLPRVVALRWSDPGTTALMALRAERGNAIRPRSPVALRELPSSLAEAVLAAEDDRFATHGGFHPEGLREALRRNLREGRLARGGSTITQQLAKNLWLSPARNPLRKAKEALLVVALEAALPKPRILEVYLNTIEWGPGLFGVDAAAREFFGKPAARVGPRESALLAAAIPDPLRQRPDRPSRYLRGRQAVLLGRIARWDLAPEEWTRHRRPSRPRVAPAEADAPPAGARPPTEDDLPDAQPVPEGGPL